LTVHSPEPDHDGDVGGVRFTSGTASVDPQAPHAAAALAYFRRSGYRVTDDTPAEQAEPLTPDAPSVAVFDPGAHTVADVLAHLAEADEDERARVLSAEAAGDARATILKKGPASE
ncbi:hypothetical protein, partial [Streptomyces sp. NPDC048551]|uniref:hypothetical protein n=1 Tax=Streptomyces sp. NPDC048551 TaxID=3155758 RepID=UPI00341A1438